MRKPILAAALAATISMAPQIANAETIFGALAKAYENNSELNSARAGVRVVDENVALAKSGYRPRVTGTAGITNSWSDATGRGITSASFGIEISQSIFDGFQTRNNVRAATSAVAAAATRLSIHDILASGCGGLAAGGAATGSGAVATSAAR